MGGWTCGLDIRVGSRFCWVVKMEDVGDIGSL